MKVCIVGAGLSGLSSALSLEKYGFVPDVYEQFDCPGGMVPFMVCLLQLIKKPIPDPLINYFYHYYLGCVGKYWLIKSYGGI